MKWRKFMVFGFLVGLAFVVSGCALSQTGQVRAQMHGDFAWIGGTLRHQLNAVFIGRPDSRWSKFCSHSGSKPPLWTTACTGALILEELIP